jgi:hypothetical protein
MGWPRLIRVRSAWSPVPRPARAHSLGVAHRRADRRRVLSASVRAVKNSMPFSRLLVAWRWRRRWRALHWLSHGSPDMAYRLLNGVSAPSRLDARAAYSAPAHATCRGRTTTSS